MTHNWLRYRTIDAITKLNCTRLRCLFGNAGDCYCDLPLYTLRHGYWFVWRPCTFVVVWRSGMCLFHFYLPALSFHHRCLTASAELGYQSKDPAGSPISFFQRKGRKVTCFPMLLSWSIMPWVNQAMRGSRHIVAWFGIETPCSSISTTPSLSVSNSCFPSFHSFSFPASPITFFHLIITGVVVWCLCTYPIY